MTTTRAQFEKVLIKRAGNLMTAAGLDGTTIDGNNDDLQDPIATALRQAGYGLTDISQVTDEDLAAVVSGDLDKLLDLAELRTLENILGNYDAVDLRVGPRDEKLHQLADTLQKRVKDKRMDLLTTYGIGMPDAIVTTAPFYGPTTDPDAMLWQ